MTIGHADIVIRPFTPHDLPVVLEKHQELYAQEFNYPADPFGKVVSEGLDQFLNDGGRVMWIAEHRPKPNSAAKAWYGRDVSPLYLPRSPRRPVACDSCSLLRNFDRADWADS